MNLMEHGEEKGSLTVKTTRFGFFLGGLYLNEQMVTRVIPWRTFLYFMHMVAEVLNGQKFDEIWVLSGLSGCDVTWVIDLYLKTSPENRMLAQYPWQVGVFGSYALDGTFIRDMTIMR